MAGSTEPDPCRSRRRLLAASLLAVVLLGDLAVADEPAPPPLSNLDYWLDRSEPVEPPPATPDLGPDGGRNPFVRPGGFGNPHAVPGVIILSDGRVLPGGIHTTAGRDLNVFVESEQRWRRVPLAAVLSISAIVVEEEMELEWRWRATGVPERVYTGRQYPTRRFEWAFRLVDGSTITGAVKGQPLYLESAAQARGPWILHERSKGEAGESLDDLLHVRKVIVSRRVMEQVMAAGPAAGNAAGQ